MPKWPAFIGGSAPASSLIQDGERSINLYVEKSDSQAAASPAALYPTPGFASWTTVTQIGTRALARVKDQLFGVVGSRFYEWSQTGVKTDIGAVALDGYPAQIVFNGVVGGQVGIASGGSIYCYDLTSHAFTTVLTGGFSMLAYADGYGLAFNPTTGKVRLSGLNDLTTWDASKFFQRSKFPDPWQTMFVDKTRLIWLIGTETFEVWYDTGQGTQPWAPLSGLYGRWGIAAPFAFGVSRLGVYWIARSAEGGASVVTTKGSVPQVISPYGVNTALTNYLRSSSISDAELLLYHDAGHTFANFSFPAAAATWTLDAEQRAWAERGRWNTTTGQYDIWAPRCHADIWGKHLVGDRATGTIWTMDTALSTEMDGTGIRRLRRSGGLTQEHKRIPIDNVELLMDVGLGTSSGQGANPQAMLRVSEDGGRSFGNERTASVGRKGEYRRKVNWNRLGASPDAVIDIAWADPSPTRVVDAWLNNAEQAA